MTWACPTCDREYPDSAAKQETADGTRCVVCVDPRFEDPGTRGLRGGIPMPNRSKRAEQAHMALTVVAAGVGVLLDSPTILGIAGGLATAGVLYWPRRRHRELVNNA